MGVAVLLVLVAGVMATGQAWTPQDPAGTGPSQEDPGRRQGPMPLAAAGPARRPRINHALLQGPEHTREETELKHAARNKENVEKFFMNNSGPSREIRDNRKRGENKRKTQRGDPESEGKGRNNNGNSRKRTRHPKSSVRRKKGKKNRKHKSSPRRSRKKGAKVLHRPRNNGGSDDAVRVAEVCSRTVNLGYDSKAVIFSANDGMKKSCKLTLKSPKDTTMSISCPQFNLNKSCKKDKLLISGLKDDKKATFCRSEGPDGDIPATNIVKMKYRRTKMSKKSCSGGFMCMATVVEGGGGGGGAGIISTTTTPTYATYTTTTPNTRVVSPSTSPPSTCTDFSRPFCEECGQSPISVPDYKIVNGSNASEGEYPYQAAIGTLNFKYCGGSLINRRWVLSAAHCFYESDVESPRGVVVSLGELRASGDNPGSLSIRAKAIIRHEDFNSLNFKNDVALVKLEEDVTFTDKIQPICLGEEGDVPLGGMAVVTGWGDLESGAGNFPDILQEVALDVLTNEDCEEIGQSDSDIFLCALTRFKDSCQGDSGGPLVAKACAGRWVQVGIVSHGVGCAFEGYPGIYTRVPAYLDWITSKIGSSTC